MKDRPILYLDLDDTLLTWSSGKPLPAEGAREFLGWALDRFEIRWLTRWCPSGEMPEPLLHDLARLLGMDVERLRCVSGYPWEPTGSKLDGIAWLDHIVLDRPFLWLEDEIGVGELELRFLTDAGLVSSYRHCNVTRDPAALSAARAWMTEWLREARIAA